MGKIKKITNKRDSTRHLLIAPIEVIDDKGDAYNVMSDNVSDTGLYLVYDNLPLPPLNTVLQVKVMGTLGDGAEAPVNKARVVRHDSKGIGLQFIFEDTK